MIISQPTMVDKEPKKSNFWGVIFMKLSYEDKIKIYELRQSGQSIKSLSKQFAIAESSVKYMIRLIDRYGINIIQKGKNTYYPPEFKQEMIDKVLIDGHSLNQVALEYLFVYHHLVLDKHLKVSIIY